ncbi:ATP-binding cassette domain-containing protein [Mycoplasmopsis felis]|uniref:ATP-binding cassette domain-containing protein n=1 Tax=Mycoplasmopsis felis TaxID=33923 RepID=UPI002AFEDDA9|nr:ATP-binding cassette domain-containing protein [Mycoplasmopsis felis]WQQ05937.1 ATP-binding cassette domain-containing protein [Mycoplasmopsis felis]
MSKKTILEINNLKKFFVNKNIINKAVDDVSFDLKEGEIVGLIGESGSGKTTIGRSLLRLYDDYNGFVRLDGKLISGKKISRKTNKFMRKNIQMIFQDPMAALNGQNTVFSILKESLVVNKIITNQIKDIKKDWYQVQDNFHFTFLESALSLKLENLKIANSLMEPFVEKWNKYLLEIDFEKEESSFEDKFNHYFSYLEEKSKNNSKIINSLYKNTEKLISLYNDSQNHFRNSEIDFDELELKNTKSELKKQKDLLKHTSKYYEYKETTKQDFKTLYSVYSQWKEEYFNSLNSINNLYAELKNEAKLLKNEAYTSPYVDFYAYKLKLYLLNKYTAIFFKKQKRNLLYLKFEDLQSLIKEIESASLKFFLEELNIEVLSFKSLNEYKKHIETLIKTKFIVNIDNYIIKSKEFTKLYKDQRKHSVQTFTRNFKKTFIEFFKKPVKNIDNFKHAQENYQTAHDNWKKELEHYVNDYNLRIESLNKEIYNQEVLSKELNENNKALLVKFFEKHKEFIKYFKQNGIQKTKELIKDKKIELKNNSTNEKIKKSILKLENKLSQYNVDLKVYKSNVKDKLNSIKAFDIESKYLNKDLSNIYVFLGISKYDLWVKNLKIRPYLNCLTKWYRLREIKNLLTRTTIYKSLEDVGLLKQFAYRYPHEFSGGQRQRIVIARALITQPKVIVADEPIASLDISIQAQVVNLLKDLCKEKNIAMIFIAHDLSMIEYIADRVQIMHLGKIVESGDTESIYKKPIHPYTINLFKAIPKISNANEKFQDVKFELSYMSEQVYPNIPYVHEVYENKHYVYGTKEQIDKWTK